MEKDSNYSYHFEVLWPHGWDNPGMIVHGHGEPERFQIKDKVLSNKLWSELRKVWLTTKLSDRREPQKT